MLIVKVYTVLDTLALEVSCYHAGDPASSHMLIRETTQGPVHSVASACQRIADVLSLEASLRRSSSDPDDPRCLEVL